MTRPVIGSRWTPAHAVHRSEQAYWERNTPADQWSRDALALQRVLLPKKPTLRNKHERNQTEILR